LILGRRPYPKDYMKSFKINRRNNLGNESFQELVLIELGLLDTLGHIKEKIDVLQLEMAY